MQAHTMYTKLNNLEILLIHKLICKKFIETNWVTSALKNYWLICKTWRPIKILENYFVLIQSNKYFCEIHQVVTG